MALRLQRRRCGGGAGEANRGKRKGRRTEERGREGDKSKEGERETG